MRFITRTVGCDGSQARRAGGAGDFLVPPVPSFHRGSKSMDEKDFILGAREHGPMAVRTLAEIAHATDNAPVRKRAIAELVARRFLTATNPTDADLERIENMTDDEISAVFRAASR